jgi:heme-degrading monooxygenase HmoA
MIALFFEVKPNAGQYDRYLALAAALKPQLDSMGGCLFIDRFRSLQDHGQILSFQVWRDEAALTAWRVHEAHHRTQEAGREEIFADYRLRVAQVIRLEEPGKPAWQPQRLSAWHDPAVKPPRFCVIGESTSAELDVPGGCTHEIFESINRSGEFAHLVSVPGYATALEVTENCRIGAPAYRFRVCEIERDYGMFDRAEAPQYYPAIKR